jgi:uncharacterized protein (TIGR02246 family)
MTFFRIGAVAALVGTIALASTQLGAQDTATREARDRAEIDALMWRYVRALDTRNPEAYAAVYTPDGQFGSGATPTKGREALTKMVAGLRDRATEAAAKGQPGPAMYHVITNPYLEFMDKDHARLHAYWMTVFGANGEKVPPRVAAAGRSVDQLVRVNGKWLIQSRDVAPKD